MSLVDNVCSELRDTESLFDMVLEALAREELKEALNHLVDAEAAVERAQKLVEDGISSLISHPSRVDLPKKFLRERCRCPAHRRR